MADDKTLEQKQAEYAAKKAALTAKVDAKNTMLKEGRIFFHNRDVKIFPFRSDVDGIAVGFLVNPKELIDEDFCEGEDIIVFAFSAKNDKDKFCPRTARGLIGYRMSEYIKNFTSTDPNRRWFEDNVFAIYVPKEITKKYLQSSTDPSWVPFSNLHNLFSLELLNRLLTDRSSVNISEKSKTTIIESILGWPPVEEEE